MTRLLAIMALAPILLVGCGKSEETLKAVAVEAKPQSYRESPDFGGVEFVTIEAEGVGDTPALAALRALDMAISQVNGRRVSSASESVTSTASLDVEGLWDANIQSFANVEKVVASSNGAVRSFTVVSSEEIERVDAEYAFSGQFEPAGWFGDKLEVSETERQMSRYWRVKVKAEVAKFKGPKDDGRPSIVISAPRTSGNGYAIGDSRVDPASVAAEIRARLSDALTQTERFKVLDREFSAELQSEVDFINSGNARNEEVARLGQRLATDLILVPTIEQFAYPRSSRKLQMSGRELTSYSGGGRVSLKLINATTGEVVLSESFEHKLKPTQASTLPRSVDGTSLAGELMDSLSSRMTKSVVNEIFPISVVAMTDNQVVLSQGGRSVAVGDRYDAVVLGAELKDPQTGRSLGRTELPCCVIRVDRVADKTSYGTIEGTIPPQLTAFTPGMVELRGLASSPGSTAAAENTDRNGNEEVRPSARSVSKPKPRVEAAAENTTEDQDW